MFYGTQNWDPLTIILQIFSVQCLFYVSLAFSLWMFVGPFASGNLTVYSFFNSNWHLYHASIGWSIWANLFNSLFTSIIIMFVVERAKKCLDFAATVYLIHFGLCSILVKFPTSAAWWLSNCPAFAITAVLSEWLCLRRELQEIPLGVKLNSIADLTSLTAASKISAVERIKNIANKFRSKDESRENLRLVTSV